MKNFFLLLMMLLLTSCGFHLRGQEALPPNFQNVFIKTKTPFSDFTQNLTQYLEMSHVHVVESPHDANVILDVLAERSSQQLLGVNSTQLTRQYNLITAVDFQITLPDGKILLAPQTASETRVLAVNANQILAGSNESQQLIADMRRNVVYDVMNVLSSRMVAAAVSHIGPAQ